ncbi:hypothetical protein LRP30_40740 [Bradyrhizobium sp. C-145]|uniref:hypothetical protein n=1 Tax=Bradyrhizobium sp. C-145 TaxID=574727 RepID=UPI00201B8CB7|nr:hypothetical protein [Bradyrhizobium sp. C-145]UQR62997.1 hypothetical protein LRP30_40740 [Bradyrhizobium sp. C-145]
MAEKKRTDRDAPAPPGHKKVQMPMQTLKVSEWEAVMKQRIMRKVEELVEAERLTQADERLDEIDVQEIVADLVPDWEGLLLEAISIHLQFYSQAADVEAGFPLALKPAHVVVAEPSGYAIVYATIDREACSRLLGLDGVRDILERLTRDRRAQYRSAGLSTKIDDAATTMDLLVSSLPYTTETIGDSTAATIVDRAIENRLERYESLATPRRRARKRLELVAIETVSALRRSSRTLH